MAPRNPIVNLIVQGARARGLDPAAVLAVASQEGLSGRIGDGGHAYGPFQLNNAGGVITGSHPGVNDRATQAWASSPAGINFALDRIAQVARGLHGAQAVNAIVTQFERPRNPGREVAGANAAYGGYTGYAGGAPTAPPDAPQGPAQPVRPGQAKPDTNTLAILNEGAKLFGLPPLPAIPNVPSSAPLRLPTAGPVVPSSPAPAQPTQPLKVKGPTLGWLEHQAAPFGLTITSTTGGKHAAHSYHYQQRAVDLGGPPSKMAAAANYALQHPGQFTEMFYTGPGHPDFFISGGKVMPLSQLDKGLYAEHTNHVHWAR